MDLIYGRKVLKRVNVMPSTHEARQFETELNSLDAAFFLVPEVPVVWVWKNLKLDFELLRRGLERALNRVPILAGRTKAGKKRMMVSNIGSDGAVLEFQVDRKMPSENAHASAWAKYGMIEPLVPMEPIEVPLLSATLTHFEEGGCSLFVRFSHLVSDGNAMVSFMQIWSWETAVAINSPDVIAQTYPSQNPPNVNCSHALPEKDVPLTEEDMSQRMSIPKTLRFLTTFPLIRVTDECIDFEFTMNDWNELKTNMMKTLPKGAWMSSYEALMGLVLQCLAKAEGRTTIDARAVVNIRGRSSMFSDNYFGVGLSVHEANELPVQGSAAETAYQLHESLRKGLKDVTDMEKLVKLPEKFGAIDNGMMGSLLAGRELMLERARYLTVWENCVWEDKAVINSWVGYPWLDINFGMAGGKSSRPNYMRVPPEFRMRRHLHIAPKSENVFQLRMQLPSKTMQAFKHELAASGFKFREVLVSGGDSIVEAEHHPVQIPLFDTELKKTMAAMIMKSQKNVKKHQGPQRPSAHAAQPPITARL